MELLQIRPFSSQTFLTRIAASFRVTGQRAAPDNGPAPEQVRQSAADASNAVASHKNRDSDGSEYFVGFSVNLSLVFDNNSK